MKVAILGYAGQGQSSYDHWNDGFNEITICDRTTSLAAPAGVATQLGDGYLANLTNFDILVRTPALHPREIVAACGGDESILARVTSNTNEFFRICPTKNIIGVTGTKGKGTVSTLIAGMLQAAGKMTHLGGNIGIPPLTLLKNDIQPADWVVLELANFQLIDLKYSPPIATVLMVEPEHLDWHDDFEEYVAAKQQLFMHQNETDIAIYYAHNETALSIADASAGRLLPYMEAPGAAVVDDQIVIDGQTICALAELKMLGEHNWQNACAAVTTAWQITHDTTALRSVLTTFSGLPFRIEFRAEVDGISYYNDSFASGGGACVAAIKSIPGTKVMIIGGYDRQLDLHSFAAAVKEAGAGLRKVMLIGQSAERMAESLKTAGFTNYVLSPAKTMPDIVNAATELAQPGDAVVLSPGFASFDMFKNFEDRGQLYNAAVAAL